MMNPANNKKSVGVLTGFKRNSIVKVSGFKDGSAIKSFTDSYPACGTPMKLTRSFPAKAIASEKVPTRTTIRRILILKTESKTCKKIVKNRKIK